jgi:hypothetical protein
VRLWITRDQQFGRHGQAAVVGHSAQPSRTSGEALCRGRVHLGAEVLVGKGVGHAGEPAVGGVAALGDCGDRGLGERAHLLGEAGAGRIVGLIGAQ